MYNETVMSNFRDPQNVGEMADASGVGEVGNVVCGDILRVYIKVKDDRLDDVKYMTYGCGAAVASGSMMTALAKGKTVEDGLKLSNKDVAAALGGLPAHKVHCSNLAADALHKAIRDWQRKTGQLPEGYKEADEEHDHDDEDGCVVES